MTASQLALSAARTIGGTPLLAVGSMYWSPSEGARLHQTHLDIRVEPVDVARRLRHLSVRDPVDDALVGGIRPIRALQMLAAHEPLGRHLADHADIPVVTKNLLDLEAAVAAISTQLLDDRRTTTQHAAQPGRHAGRPERRHVREQLAVAVEVLVPGGLPTPGPGSTPAERSSA